MSEKLDYAADIRIDETALDVEWLEQSALAMKYGKHFAKCQDRKRKAEENIKIIRAELTAKANKNPDKWLGVGVKPTAPVVEAFYRTQQEHLDAKEEWLEACLECDMAEVAKNEISFTRKAALEHLVRLHAANYFAGPNLPRNIEEERQKREQNIMDRVGQNLQRRKK